jgi:hypothetical protein
MPALKLRKSWEWRDWTVQSVLGSASGALGTALLSLIVTILLSRISSTEFFFQVTVNDLWGAVAVGFFAPLAASGLIGRITGTPREDVDKDKNERQGDPEGEEAPDVRELSPGPSWAAR